MSLKARDWHYICRSYSGPGSGLPRCWATYIGRSRNGTFLVRLEVDAWSDDAERYRAGHDDITLAVGDERALIEWLEKRRAPTLRQTLEALQGLPRFEKLAKMIAFRLRDRAGVRQLCGKVRT